MTSKSVTEIDVFHLYERNKKTAYDNCDAQRRRCPDFNEGGCYCHLNVPVLPITIGDDLSNCNFKIKSYINPHEDCPICLEKINKKSDAYLTNCGHAFHKSCLFKTYESQFINHKNITNNGVKWMVFRCPLCRQDLPYPDFYCRYPQWAVILSKKNYLDILEEFWLSKDYSIARLCYKSNNDHYLGMSNSCCYCKEYIKTGI
jgi:hypothetical protein